MVYGFGHGVMKHHFQSKIVGGLVEIAPTLITLIVTFFLVGYADSFVRPLVDPFKFAFIGDQSLYFPGIGIVIGIVISYLIGLFISTQIGKRCMRGLDRLMLSIPFVKSVFGVSRQIMTSMTTQ